MGVVVTVISRLLFDLAEHFVCVPRSACSHIVLSAQSSIYQATRQPLAWLMVMLWIGITEHAPCLIVQLLVVLSTVPMLVMSCRGKAEACGVVSLCRMLGV